MKRRRIRWWTIWSVSMVTEQTLLSTGFIRESHPGR
jgi:hypothetical protein